MTRLDSHTRAIIQQHIGDLKWQQGKARARQLVKDTVRMDREQTRLQWAWADLSLELVPVGAAGGDHSLQGVLLQAFLDDYEVPWTKATLHTLRQTAAAWPKSRRNRNTSFAVHKILKPHPQRYDLIRDGMTVTEALEVMGRKRPESHTPTTTPRDITHSILSWAKVLDRRTSDIDTPDPELHESLVRATLAILVVSQRLGVLDEAMARLGGGEIADAA